MNSIQHNPGILEYRNYGLFDVLDTILVNFNKLKNLEVCTLCVMFLIVHKRSACIRVLPAF